MRFGAMILAVAAAGTMLAAASGPALVANPQTVAACSQLVGNAFANELSQSCAAASTIQA